MSNGLQESYVTPAEHICTELGGLLVPSGFIVHCPVPGHGKGNGDRHPSLLVCTKPEAPGGIHVHCFAGCSPADVLAELKQRGLMPTAAAVRTFKRMDGDTTGAALRLWHEGKDPEGTIVERYLLSRGLMLDIEVAWVTRYHPRLWLKGERREYAGMLTLLSDMSTDQPCGIIRTFLDSDGRKLTRKMLGRAKRAAIKLGSNSTVLAAKSLVVGEGFESRGRGVDDGTAPSLGSRLGPECRMVTTDRRYRAADDTR